jgi:hypothetical protein
VNDELKICCIKFITKKTGNPFQGCPLAYIVKFSNRLAANRRAFYLTEKSSGE